jgi:hypothetical protein
MAAIKGFVFYGTAFGTIDQAACVYDKRRNQNNFSKCGLLVLSKGVVELVQSRVLYSAMY